MMPLAVFILTLVNFTKNAGLYDCGFHNRMLVVYDPFLSAVRKAAGKTELFPLVILLVLTAVSGLRYDVGVDYPVYREVYDSPSDIRALAFEPFWIFFPSGFAIWVLPLVCGSF